MQIAINVDKLYTLPTNRVSGGVCINLLFRFYEKLLLILLIYYTHFGGVQSMTSHGGQNFDYFEIWIPSLNLPSQKLLQMPNFNFLFNLFENELTLFGYLKTGRFVWPCIGWAMDEDGSTRGLSSNFICTKFIPFHLM